MLSTGITLVVVSVLCSLGDFIWPNHWWGTGWNSWYREEGGTESQSSVWRPEAYPHNTGTCFTHCSQKLLCLFLSYCWKILQASSLIIAWSSWYCQRNSMFLSLKLSKNFVFKQTVAVNKSLQCNFYFSVFPEASFHVLVELKWPNSSLRIIVVHW